MCLQTRIINEYRTLFPRYTLRETSAQTGIQLTRIFRIYNGAPMKLGEYEVFHSLVHGASASTGMQGAFRRVTEVITRTFSHKDIEKVTLMLERQLQWHELVHSGQPARNFDQAVMA